MLGTMPEPVGALPKPIGLAADVMAGSVGLLKRQGGKPVSAPVGARRAGAELRRVANATGTAKVWIARTIRDPEPVAALSRKGVEGVNPGYGIDAVRIGAVVTKPLTPQQIDPVKARHEDALNDLICRLGNQPGFDHVLRFLPATHPPPFRKRRRRPAMIVLPVPVTAASGRPPAQFR